MLVDMFGTIQPKQVSKESLSPSVLKASREFSILYVGDLAEGGTCRQRFRALTELGHDLKAIDLNSGQPPGLWMRLRNKLGWPRDEVRANQTIRAMSMQDAFDVLWLDKAVTIWPETIEFMKDATPDVVITGYSPDDMAAGHNQSRYFLQTLPLYDIFFTTKSFGVRELTELGCRRVRFVNNAFDVLTHKPISVSRKERHILGGSVGFIGTWELQRSQSVLHLAQSGIHVTLWGNKWKEQAPSHHYVAVRGASRYGTDYARIICSFDINLCFLRKANRDLQTTRSVEIPACGAFMLAERTDEHLALFKEGREAEFFSSDDELLDKTKYYLAHPKKRKRIAAAGRERCIKSGYSYHDRLKEMLKVVTNLSRRNLN